MLPEIRYVYVAGPYTKGNQAENVAVAIAAGDTLWNAGYIPYIPHLTHFWHLLFQHDYDSWLELDLAWIRKCDAVCRLPGDSRGADMEERFCAERRIPVFTLEELLDDTENEFPDEPAGTPSGEVP